MLGSEWLLATGRGGFLTFRDMHNLLLLAKIIICGCERVCFIIARGCPRFVWALCQVKYFPNPAAGSKKDRNDNADFDYDTECASSVESTIELRRNAIAIYKFDGGCLSFDSSDDTLKGLPWKKIVANNNYPFGMGMSNQQMCSVVS